MTSSSHVIGLQLSQNNLVGKLPPLRGLQNLLHLDFSNPSSPEDSNGSSNVLGGTLGALCGLGNLSTVWLAYNSLTGYIPDCVQSLVNVSMLDLDHNAIEGPTPNELCQLHKLEELHLRGNRLQSTVPVCFGEALEALRVLDYSNLNPNNSQGNQSRSGTLPTSLCELKNLEVMLFQGTHGLHGSLPDCLGAKQPQLQGLALQNNRLHGTFPPSICEASALKYLVLFENTLTGSIPSCLGSLSHLFDLQLSSNHLHGLLPEKLCHASASLVLYDNDLTGTIPSCLGNLKQLYDLELSSNEFYGSMPGDLCQATSLEILYMFDNALTGTLPSCLGSLSQINELDLSTNQFHGAIPEDLCLASALEVLYLFDNALTGTLPTSLGNLDRLSALALGTNPFHGTIPSELCQASELTYLALYDNTLTGTLPSCLGSLSHLYDLGLSNNNFYSTIPQEFCRATSLEFPFLYDNALTGSLPSCLATSFPSLETMLLHNNDFAGALPSEWALPSLISVMLSNNPDLSGSLPPSLFLQPPTLNASESSNNDVLRAVIIEGTAIGGTLPTALCSAPRLQALVLSGNELNGSLPNCIVSLQTLQTLRISNNHLTGTIPVGISNMTSFTVLDLSTNQLQGRVPAALGDISSNLDTVQLQLNRLSCDLPESVLDWQASSANISFNLLNGNLFGCGTNTYSRTLALSIQGAVGLRNANVQAFDAYSCGNSDYVLPAITLVVLAVPIIIGLVVTVWCGRLALQWRAALEWTVNPTTLINELDHADRQLRALALGAMAAATLTGSLALTLSLHASESIFECEYMAAPTLANKRDSDAYTLSLGVGVAGCFGLVLGLAPWWYRLVSKCSRAENEYGGYDAENKPLYSLEESAEAWNFDAERMAEAIPQKPESSYFGGIVRALKLVALLVMLGLLTFGPNFGYVVIVLSELTQEQKVVSELAITLTKTLLGRYWYRS